MDTHTSIPVKRLEKIDMPAGQFRQLGYFLIDQIAEFYAAIGEQKVTPAENYQTVEKLLHQSVQLTENGEDPQAILKRATDLLTKHSLFNGHPNFWGYITASPSMMGILGDLLAAGMNPNVGAYVLSPMASEIEKQVVSWMGDFMRYPAAGGVLVSGGNMANNIGFLAAMRAKVGDAIRTKGLRGIEEELVAYCSGETHTWIQKSADLSGLGTNIVRWVETDEQGRMDVSKLKKAITTDLKLGKTPFLVVGTGGSVSTGIIDPLETIADLCAEYEMWFHIDGAYGGFAAALPELANNFRGLERADSIAVDPHKWLYAPLEAGCVLVKDTAHLTNTFSYHPPYYNFEQAGTNFVDYGPQNSRGFRALKVWLSFQHLGIAGHTQLIREDIQLAQYAFQKLKELDCFQVFSCYLSITTFRYVPDHLKDSVGKPETETYLNELNQHILNEIELSGRYFISKAVIKGAFTLRLCLVNFRTTATDVETFPGFVQHIGEKLGKNRKM